MTVKPDLQKITQDAYDSYPYISYPFAATHPYHLNSLATLFGMNPPKVETARVLELGCAGGGNIIPHAVNYPNAHFVGLDISKMQIDEANKEKTNLGLTNIEFHHCSITDIDEKFGKFDYIICHGVFSWVPEFVRSKILEIYSKNLTPNGLAYVSYNTLPGWNMVRTIRDMMRYHSAGFATIPEKVIQSKLLLNFIQDSIEGSKSPYAEVLKTEAELLSKQQDSYLAHEHLEETNQQFYFHEFMAEAAKYNLQYLSDASVASMYLGNMPAKAVETLKSINDIVRTEQYMDFITNRRFRSTILCHNNVKLNRNLKNEDINKFHMTLRVTPEKAEKDVDFNTPEQLTFYCNNNKDSTLSTSSPAMKAILYCFAENTHKALSFDEVVSIANKKLGGTKIAEVKSYLLNNSMTLVLQGYIQITTNSSLSNIDPDLKLPKTTKLVAAQANSALFWVTNMRHEAIAITIFEKFMLKYMNGTNDKGKIVDFIVSHVLSGEMIMNKDGKPIEKVEEIRREIEAVYDDTLIRFAQSLLLL